MTTIDFATFDKFGRKDFADRLTKVITAFYPFYSEAFVLSLNARFGSGKTTFLKMWQNQLEEDDKLFKVVYINAWETDFDDEPIIPIISALLDSLDTKEKPLKTNLKKALGTLALYTNGVIDHVTGINVIEGSEKAGKAVEAQDLEKAGEEIFKEYSFKKDAYKQLRDALSNYVSKLDNKPLIVLVDELDRARPNYSVKFLEAIKHIFSVKGICFVLAVDKGQLEQSVRQIYGGVDFENYYRRFITREAQLPELKNIDLIPFIQQLSKDFFDEKTSNGINFAFNKQSQNEVINFIESTCKKFDFAPREIESLFRMFTQIMAVSTVGKTALESWISMTVLMIAISIKSPDLYKKLGLTKVSPKALYEYLSSIYSNDRTALYVYQLALSFNMHGEDNESGNLKEILATYALINGLIGSEINETQREQILQDLRRQVSTWPRYPTRPMFQELYEHIENWREFLS